jgi:class 3 adenylate cyclase
MSIHKSIKHIESLVKTGRAFEAHNEIINLGKNLSENLRVKQLYALTLSRLGANEKALRILEPVYENGNDDPETSGIIGRIYKACWKNSGDISYARKSRDIYLHSFRIHKNYYPGINAATMSLIIGEQKTAEKIAREVLDNMNPADNYWEMATLGELFLILGELDKSFDYYSRAKSMAGNDSGNISSSCQQLYLISPFITIPEEIFEIMKPPKVIVFSGHMLDKPDRPGPRFTENMIDYVREQIQQSIFELDCKIAYTSAACGSDLIFIEEMKKVNGEVNIVLPFDTKDFLRSSVNYAGKAWVEKFHDAINSSCVTMITEENFLGCNALFSFTNDILIGMANLRSYLLHSKAVLLAVVNNSDRVEIKGGVKDVIKSWKYPDSMHIIDLQRFKNSSSQKHIPIINDSGEASSKVGDDEVEIPKGLNRVIKCILFADIVGFSKIPEEHTPYFMFEILRTIGNKMKELGSPPEIINTWGDAIFAVYENAAEIMEFAVTLQEIMETSNWLEMNLPIKLNIRISLHTGPVFMTLDSITHRLNAYGTHINRTARMEPITIPGCIYASQQFASKLIYETDNLYQYEYVGFIELPKKFGKQEMFRIIKSGNSTG